MPTLTGIVQDGYGRAQFDVHGGIYDLLDVDLFPGTLNLELVGSTGTALPPEAVSVTAAGITRRLWQARVRGRTVWLLHADHLGTTVELLAGFHLRSEFGLSNGDFVEVELIDAPVPR